MVQLDDYAFVDFALSSYDVFHTQGYEYIGEMLKGKLQELQERQKKLCLNEQFSKASACP